MLQKSELVTIRNWNIKDRNFVLATWLRGLYYGDSWFTLIPKHIFMNSYHTVLDKLLKKDNTIVIISCLKDDPEVILGYSVISSSKKVLNWVYVKSAWRGIGIARSLVPKSIEHVTHLTKSGLGILKKHPEVSFNPFAIGE